jgi:hypothetical protein
MVSVVVLTILVIVLSRIVTSASTVTTLGHMRMDTDSQVRPVFDRMAADFGQMIKRPDVDYHVKSVTDLESGNDHIAFFTQVPGYYPSGSTQTSQSPVSLISYRVYSPSATPSPCPNCNKMERMGKGLLWNGVSSPSPIPKPFLFGYPDVIKNNWASATDNSTTDSDYETIGPQVFRFEYFYVLKTGTLASNPGNPGMQDVSAIVATVAVVDPKSKVLLSDAQIATLIGRLVDFDPNTHTKIGDLSNAWQSTLNGTTDMVRSAIAGIRIYQRTFYLLPTK